MREELCLQLLLIISSLFLPLNLSLWLIQLQLVINIRSVWFLILLQIKLLEFNLTLLYFYKLLSSTISLLHQLVQILLLTLILIRNYLSKLLNGILEIKSELMVNIPSLQVLVPLPQNLSQLKLLLLLTLQQLPLSLLMSWLLLLLITLMPKFFILLVLY